MKRKIKKAVIILAIIVFLIIGIAVYFLFHPTYWKYNDYWIIGKHYTEIEKRYGEFDMGYSYKYYIGDWTDMFDGGRFPVYYFIYFDENGYAIKVEKEIYNPGG